MSEQKPQTTQERFLDALDDYIDARQTYREHPDIGHRVQVLDRREVLERRLDEMLTPEKS